LSPVRPTGVTCAGRVCGVLLRLPLQHLSSLAELSACMDVAPILWKNAGARLAVK
jgi:hypothetical protein